MTNMFWIMNYFFMHIQWWKSTFYNSPSDMTFCFKKKRFLMQHIDIKDLILCEWALISENYHPIFYFLHYLWHITFMCYNWVWILPFISYDAISRHCYILLILTFYLFYMKSFIVFHIKWFWFPYLVSFNHICSFCAWQTFSFQRHEHLPRPHSVQVCHYIALQSQQ